MKGPQPAKQTAPTSLPKEDRMSLSPQALKPSSISHVRRITREELDHLRDPIARLVWNHWIATGEAALETAHAPQ